MADNEQPRVDISKAPSDQVNSLAGSMVFVETLTYHYVAEFVGVDYHYVALRGGAKVMNTDHPGKFLVEPGQGDRDEYYRYPKDKVYYLPRGCVTMIAPMAGELPDGDKVPR